MRTRISTLASTLLLWGLLTRESLSFAFFTNNACGSTCTARLWAISDAPTNGDTSVVEVSSGDVVLEPDKNASSPSPIRPHGFVDGTKELQKQEDQQLVVDDDTLSIFDIVAGCAATCLVESDLRRDAKAEYSNVVSSSATNWINDATAFALQKAFDRLKLKVRHSRVTGILCDCIPQNVVFEF